MGPDWVIRGDTLEIEEKVHFHLGRACSGTQGWGAGRELDCSPVTPSARCPVQS